MLYDTPYLLIADDTTDTLEFLKAGVTMRGWKCKIASTPQQILNTLETEVDDEGHSLFDVMITDISYPDKGNGKPGDPPVTGVSVVRKLRRTHKNLPVIFITAHDIRVIRNEALAVGQELIAKPFEVDYLLDRAKLWIDWYSPNKYKGEERRSYGINRSGHYRRTSDTHLVVGDTFRQSISSLEVNPNE